MCRVRVDQSWLDLVHPRAEFTPGSAHTSAYYLLNGLRYSALSKFLFIMIIYTYIYFLGMLKASEPTTQAWTEEPGTYRNEYLSLSMYHIVSLSFASSVVNILFLFLTFKLPTKPCASFSEMSMHRTHGNNMVIRRI